MKVIREPKKIVLYTRAMCGWCDDAKDWLKAHRWSFVARDTGTDLAARDEAFKLSGQKSVPVIQIDGMILGDFDTDQLEAFLEQHGYLQL